MDIQTSSCGKILRAATRPHTHRRIRDYARNPYSQLGSGVPAAHEKIHLMLLGSPPDMVRGISLRGTDSSSPLIWVRQHSSLLGWDFIPAVADCRQQGTANSPTSAALSQTEGPEQSETSILYFSPFFKGKMRDSLHLTYLHSHNLSSSHPVKTEKVPRRETTPARHCSKT